jgi:FixJ family two-component response regulator
MDAEPTVIIIAGDCRVRRDLTVRLERFEPALAVFHSVEEFFERNLRAGSGCIVLGVSPSGVELELLDRPGQDATHLPVVAVTPPGDVATAVAAMKAGAHDAVEESCPGQRLIQAVTESLDWHAAHRRHVAQLENIRRRLARLTPGHREVLDLIVAGKSNREVAEALKLSVRAIEVRRAKVMATMHARSLAELVRQTMSVEGVRIPAGVPGG